MANAFYTLDRPSNDPMRGYLPGSPEKAELKAELKKQAEQVVKIPLIIGGKEVWTDRTFKVTMPHDHSHVLAECCLAGEKELKDAVAAALAAKDDWERTPWEQKIAIFLKAADYISGSYRKVLMASTMLGQGKVVFQAEIDIAQTADFLRFNVWNAQEIFKDQPKSGGGALNRQDYRPLDGFVCAITPFNFTSIGANLPTAPAIVGNVSLWKPARTAVLSNYYYMKLLMDCGLPAGVINFLPCSGSDMSKYVLTDPNLAGFHFTGSTEVFREVWKLVGNNIENYRSYPRLVGETGGKDFIFAHSSAEIEPLVAAIIRGAFELTGQKCSACSRVYVPKSIWPQLKARLVEETAKLKVGDVTEFDTFMGAVIDQDSFRKCKGFLDRAAASPDCTIITGGHADDSKGWFVEPTIIECADPLYESMVKEIFGPIVSIHPYADEDFDKMLELCDKATQYSLTGSIFAKDRKVIEKAEWVLRNASGNFYINDKCTGAVVGQQPFGGARASGTNDKAGSILNMIRWLSPHSVKETYCPSPAIAYPYMKEQ